MMDSDTGIGDRAGATSSVKIAIGSLMIIQILAGLFGNSIILSIFWRFKELRTPSNNLLIFLALSDIGMCCCIPFSTASMFSGRWIFDRTGCQFYGFASMFFGLSIIGLLTCLSIDRYIVVCRRSFASFLTHSHYKYMATAAYVNALFWAIVPLLGWAHYEEDGSSGCSIDWRRGDASYISYLFVLFTACFVLPLGVMVLCFGRAHAVIIKRQQVQDSISNSDGALVNSDWANQKQVTQVVVALVIVYLITWSPFAIICMWGALGNPDDVPHWLATLAPFTAKCSQFINPLMFVIFIKKFRDCILVILCCRTHVEAIELAPPSVEQDAIEGEL